MKKVILLVLLISLIILSSCEQEQDNGDCNCIAVKTSLLAKETIQAKEKVTICHYDEATDTFVTLTINENGLNGHKNHPLDDLNGQCKTAGLDDIFGIFYSNNCNDNGKQVTIANSNYKVICEAD